MDEQLLGELALGLELRHQLGDLVPDGDGLHRDDVQLGPLGPVEVGQAQPVTLGLARAGEAGQDRRTVLRAQDDDVVALGVAREVAEQRARVHTDASDCTQEEDATCYLQILLSDRLPGVGRERLMRDMDEWGYSFRLGSARAWFEQDADDARRWLAARGLTSG